MVVALPGLRSGSFLGWRRGDANPLRGAAPRVGVDISAQAPPSPTRWKPRPLDLGIGSWMGGITEWTALQLIS